MTDISVSAILVEICVCVSREDKCSNGFSSDNYRSLSNYTQQSEGTINLLNYYQKIYFNKSFS